MIDAQLHPLDEVTRFGSTCHGLMTPFNGTVLIDSTAWPLPGGYPNWSTYDVTGSGVVHPDFGNTHIIRAPAPTPETDPEAQAAERAAGIVWQTYSLLSSTRNLLYGHHLDGWIYVDTAGGRWLVKQASGPDLMRYGDIDQGESLEIELTLRPFGELSAPEAEPVVITASLADIGQADPPDITPERGSTLRLRTTSISSNGRDAIIALYPSITPPATVPDPRDMPYGFLRLTLSGVEGTLAAALAVEHSRTETLGERAQESTGATHRYRLQLQFSGDVEVERNEVGIPTHAEGDWDCTGVMALPYNSSTFTRLVRGAGGTALGAEFRQGASGVTNTIEGRICGVVFDANDSPLLITADLELTHEFDADYTATASGSYSINGLQSSITGSVSVDIWRSDAKRTAARLTMHLGGAADEYEFVYEYSGAASHTLTLGAASTDSNEETFGRGAFGGVFYNLDDGSATDLAGVGWDMPVFVGGSWSYVVIPASEVTWSSELTGGGGAVIDSAGGTGYGDTAASIVTGYARVGIEALVSYEPYSRYRLDCQRLCNQMCLVRIENYNSTGTTPISAHSRGVLTPRGLHEAGEVRSHTLTHTRVVGSYEPVTGDVWVDYTNASWPAWRCWV